MKMTTSEIKTPEQIADKWLIKRFSGEQDKQDMIAEINAYAQQLAKTKCEQQRAICANEWYNNRHSFNLLNADERLKIFLDADEPKF